MTNPYEIATIFAKEFASMEYALKRSSEYLRKDRNVAEADWNAFAKHLGQEFYDHVVNTGIAPTLIGKPPRRLLANLQWDPLNPVPLANVDQLIINGVCRVRNSYLHGEKFTGGPDGQWERDTKLVAEAYAVLVEARAFALS